jgi:SP family myo-inositol transporter-like MFS transporter 13
MPSSKDQDNSIPLSMWTAVLLIATQSFLFGYCFSSLNPCLVAGDSNSGSACYDGTDSCPPGSIYNDLNLSTIEAQTATSLTVAGGWIGCMIGSYPAEKYGRKFTSLVNNLFFIVGSAMAASGNLSALFIGRFIVGLGVGIVSVVTPVLLSEIAPEASRGVITTFHQLMLTVAIFMVNIIGFGFVTYVPHGWQYLQGLAIVPALCMLAMHAYVPESPKWLITHATGPFSTPSAIQNPLNIEHDSALTNAEFANAQHSRSHSVPPNSAVAPARTRTLSSSGTSIVSDTYFKKAQDTLRRLRNENWDVDREFQSLVSEHQRHQQSNQAGAEDQPVSWSEVFACREAMFIGCGLLFFQAFTGINTVVFYSTTIFSLAGFSQAIIGSACWSLLNVLMTGVAARLIDSAGRRVLLLRGTIVMLFALIALAAVLLSDHIAAKTQGNLAVVAVLLYVAGYAASLGAVPWTIISEIMPTRPRVKAVSLFLSINWGANLLIGLLTLTAINGLGGVKSGMDDDEQSKAETKGVGYLYLIFGILTALCVCFVYFVVPETKGKSPDQLNNPLLNVTSDADETESLMHRNGSKSYA